MRFREDYVDPLRACLDGADDWYKVERCFQPQVGDDDLDDGRPVVYAFGYMFVEAGREELRERVGVFAPRIEWEDGSAFPAPLVNIQDEMVAIWAQYADATDDHPVAASRLHDLLWVRRHGDKPVDHARAAVDAYVELADSWESMNLVDCFSRALEITVEIGDRERLDRVIQKTVAEIEAEIAHDEWRPGIPLRLLRGLAGLAPGRRPVELGDLLEAAAMRYGADPSIAQSVGELQAGLAPSSEREPLQRSQVARWKEEADKATGLLRYAHLQQALQLARTHGLSDLANEILRDIQAITPEELDLKPISAEISIPRAEVDAYIASFVDGPASWQDAYARFGADGPPSGKVEDNEKLVEDLAEQHPLLHLIPTQVIGERSSLIFGAQEEDEHHRVDAAQQMAMGIQIWAPIGAQIIAVIDEKFGTPSENELAVFFTTDLIDGEVGARLADGLLRFLRGDYEGALHILVPQIEAAIRGLAARIGIVVIKNPQGARPGGVRTLGAILADLDGRLDESWRRYFNNALVDSLGVNIRDLVSHGLHGPVSRNDVAICLQIAFHLRLLGLGPKDPDADDQPDS